MPPDDLVCKWVQENSFTEIGGPVYRGVGFIRKKEGYDLVGSGTELISFSWVRWKGCSCFSSLIKLGRTRMSGEKNELMKREIRSFSFFSFLCMKIERTLDLSD